ncbi:DUF4250 domain-containing protein [uncultured Clostridium sp.]|uniref:DUF4250 domain-containing protein n=1 Tax=uncultured Clostridium sp. TaxID=59620 RepID=UPI0025F2DDB3|nr:DUF4250 domain-containing protein [uncultured Clostridium sp.]
MNRDSLLAMDPVILLSVLNMKLRDNFSSLKALCEDVGVAEEEVVTKIKAIGYDYDESSNQFK